MSISSSFAFRHSFVIRHSCFVIWIQSPLASESTSVKTGPFPSPLLAICYPTLAMKVIALVMLLALSSSAEARVGETLDELSYRYGASIGHYSHDQVRFNRGHIYITVHVRNNHSIREDFGPEAGGTLSDAQIDAILKDNAKGYHWEKVGESANVVRFTRTDGHARAEVAKPNYQANEGRIKLTTTGAELIIRARP